MQRPSKQGKQGYFLFVGFTADYKIKEIKDTCGGIAVAVLVTVLDIIYESEDCFLQWNNTNINAISTRAKVKTNTVRETILKAVQVGVFNQSLFNEYKILTNVFWGEYDIYTTMTTITPITPLEKEKIERLNILLNKYKNAPQNEQNDRKNNQNDLYIDSNSIDNNIDNNTNNNIYRSKSSKSQSQSNANASKINASKTETTSNTSNSSNTSSVLNTSDASTSLSVSVSNTENLKNAKGSNYNAGYKHKDMHENKYENKHEKSFDTFWTAYPRKEHKKDAKKIWLKLKPSDELCRKILIAIEKQKQSKHEQWQKKCFVPQPTTWLNGERWNDEIYDEGKSQGEQGEKGEKETLTKGGNNNNGNYREYTKKTDEKPRKSNFFVKTNPI